MPVRVFSLLPPFSAILAMGAMASAGTPAVERWLSAASSSSDWESHPAIDPRTGDLWFVRGDKSFAGWRLMVARCVNGRRARPEPPSIAGPGLEADPWFSADGGSIWFISTRLSRSNRSSDLDIYRATRRRDGTWSAPRRLPAPVNSSEAEWFPRPGPDGWLYFGSRRPGGIGKDDIWRARRRDGKWIVENLGAGINSAGAEYELQPSPDGRWGILATDHGLFRVVRDGRGWRRERKFDSSINRNGTEIGPMISPDGGGFAFSRDAGADLSGEIYFARLTPKTAWAPRCRAG